MPRHAAILFLVITVSFTLTASESESSPLSTPPSTASVAPTEYDWTLWYRGDRYGVQQFGPVAIYPRNAHLIWRNRAYRIPVSVPWGLAFTALVISTPMGMLALRNKRR